MFLQAPAEYVQQVATVAQGDDAELGEILEQRRIAVQASVAGEVFQQLAAARMRWAAASCSTSNGASVSISKAGMVQSLLVRAM